MRTTRTRSLLALLSGLALALSAGAAAAQERAFSAETFGGASGDVPMRGLGLVLELVDADTEAPRLRLFGGAPYHPATILISTGQPEVPPAGPRGTRFLVGPAVHAIAGTFDARGFFEVPIEGLERLPAGRELYAQGVHTGILQLGDGPLVQASHGLAVQRVADEQPGQAWFDELEVHLPIDRDLAGHADLAELLQVALDSAGDSLRLALELEITVGLGIEVVEAKAGGKLQLAATVTRSADGQYEVEVAADLAVLAGVGAGAGAEVGAELANGLGATSLYRFHSAPGAARGILGMALALQAPALAGAGSADSPAMQRAVERMIQLQGTVHALRENADELEAFLWNVVDLRLASAEAFHAAARRNLVAAQDALRAASWRQVPSRAAQVALQQGLVAASGAGLRAAHAARTHAENALHQVQSAIEAKRSELDQLVRNLARVGRIASAVSQLTGYTNEHYLGWEARVTQAAEVEAKLGLPVVDIKGLESSAAAELGLRIGVRREVSRPSRPGRTILTSTYELKTKLVGALGAGFEATEARTIEVTQVFVETPDGPRSAGASVSYGLDTCSLLTLGTLVQYEQGSGRAWSVSLSDEMFLSAAGLGALTSPAALVERFGSLEIALELQDRRQKNLDFGFSIDVTGNGGGLEIEAEWADQGRLLSRSTTVAEGIQRILDGASQVIDAQTGVVTQVN